MDERIEMNKAGKRYHADNDMTVETEVRESIGALVYLMKPDAILETGTYKGQLTFAMANQLQNDAQIYTCDTQDLFGVTIPFSGRNNIEFRVCSGLEMIESLRQRGTILDMAVLDSGGDRLEEAKAVLPIVREGGIILIHDSLRPAERRAVVWLQCQGCSAIEFDTPRGLAMLQVWHQAWAK